MTFLICKLRKATGTYKNGIHAHCPIGARIMYFKQICGLLELQSQNMQIPFYKFLTGAAPFYDANLK